ncbi:uncharacterized protein DFL_005384 [Arthrobotrys flagrans]|uniref:Uncharacterized protein n=1 Tax=Arthrobotrys flagrans TaxID=97331 RepID=A0A437A7K2_ARTFL|nr:hypothetical protein DFL_005384 [Arthrobotrys flagrans]
MRHREKRAAQRKERAKAKLALKTGATEIPNGSVQLTVRQRPVHSKLTEQTSLSEIWEKERQKGKGNKSARAKDSADEISHRDLTFPIPTHLGNVTNASLGNANPKYSWISYDALLDAVLTLSPGLAVGILKLKEVRRLRDAYIHCLVKEGLQKGDLVYYRTNGAIRIKKTEWAEKLHALRIKRDILNCYSVNRETEDIMFDYKLAAKIFGGHEFPTDTRVPGIPWVLSRANSLTLYRKSSDKHDRDKEMMAEEIARGGGFTALAASDTSEETPGASVDPRVVDAASAPNTTNQQVAAEAVDGVVGTEDQNSSQVAGTAESNSTIPSTPSPEALLDGGYEYLRK